ncbi:hypothetical protein CKA32_001593 [Geitlerinema sp. FC II]|nr:hypothetical protein CKA32_001593 [Geitlerinema sp. FC II]
MHHFENLLSRSAIDRFFQKNRKLLVVKHDLNSALKNSNFFVISLN